MIFSNFKSFYIASLLGGLFIHVPTDLHANAVASFINGWYIGCEYFFYFSPIRNIIDYESEGIASLNRRNSVES